MYNHSINTALETSILHAMVWIIPNSTPTPKQVYRMLGVDESVLEDLKDLNVTPDYTTSPDYLKVLSGRSLSDELRHALDVRQPGLPLESRARRLSVGDRPARARRLSAGAGGGENAAAVTSLTGAHARELARELAERLAKAEAMAPAEREAAKMKSPPH